MPDKLFLEEYPLYRKLLVAVPTTTDAIPKPAIKMACSKCGNEQTFVMENEYWENMGFTNAPTAGIAFRLIYICVGCQDFRRVFVVRVADNRGSIQKIGQFPPWETKADERLEGMLGAHRDYLKKATLCESQGYGLGAFSYYRRIVEEIIDELLDEVEPLLSGEEKALYATALAETKQTRVTADKIALVKDLLPPILRPDGMNPLKALHETLSEGLHAESEDRCLELAMEIREVLTFLVAQVAVSREAAKSFTEGMRSLLDKKSGRSGGKTA